VTVDHLSGGRLEFGLGAGWAENEHTMLGLPFGTKGDRADWLEEAREIIRSLWTRQRTSFDGKHYKLTGAIAEPKPVQQPHPPHGPSVPADSTSSGRRRLADGLLPSYGLGFLRDPGSRAVGPGRPSRKSVAVDHRSMPR
jgi:alkanesulfonate monooxygenase SsuD/methylene tetrahydromethanopterin reductase-like flavin-dependent oxidoreductase (luciferase family)